MSYFPFFGGSCRYRHTQPIEQLGISLGMTPEEVLAVMSIPPANRSNYTSHWRNMHAAEEDAGVSIHKDKDKFQVSVDVHHFASGEISVKTADGFLVVEAKHDEREDGHGLVSRSFTRRYRLPEGVLEDTVTSRLSSDGVLTITAPLAPPKVENERVVPIVQTGPVRKQE